MNPGTQAMVKDEVETLVLQFLTGSGLPRNTIFDDKVGCCTILLGQEIVSEKQFLDIY